MPDATTTTTDTSAADKAVADSAAATAAAEKAAADKAAADTAAQQTPEQKAAAEKVAADKAAADAAAGKAVPDKYDLKLPVGSKADPAVVERTAAIARELGLSQDNAQKALGFVAQEVAAQVETQVKAKIESYQHGGAEWTKQDEEWRGQSLADPVLGANKPEQLSANLALAKRVVATFGDQASIDFLEKSGLGSHPAALKLLVKVGKAMSEGSFVQPSGASVPEHTEATVAGRMYDHPTSKPKT